jgi:ABC-type glycerol-3-phosphate transport system substrate-binding protein
MVFLLFAVCWQMSVPGESAEAKELKISLIAGFPTNIGLKTLVSEFEKETGIKITLIETGYGAVLEKNLVDLSAQTGAYDVLHVESLWFAEYLHYLQPINEFMEDSKLFNEAEYDIGDCTSYTPLTLGGFTREGKLFGLPHLAGIPLNWYRKDLMDKEGLKPPRNVDEYYEVAKKLTQDLDGDGKIDIYGVALSASRTGLVDEWLSFYFAYGGALPERPDQFLKTTFNNPTALKALNMYKKLYDECAPPESMTWEFGEVGSAMQRGVVAMMWNWSNGGSWYDDPEASKVVGKVRANVPWPGRFGVNGLCIPKDSKNKEDAFRFIAWATSKDIMHKTTLAGGATPCRTSVLADKELAKERWWFGPLREAGRLSRMYFEIPEWSAIDDALAIEFQKVLTNEMSSEEALKRASDNAYGILKEAGYFD